MGSTLGANDPFFGLDCFKIEWPQPCAAFWRYIAVVLTRTVEKAFEGQPAVWCVCVCACVCVRVCFCKLSKFVCSLVCPENCLWCCFGMRNEITMWCLRTAFFGGLVGGLTGWLSTLSLYLVSSVTVRGLFVFSSLDI